MDFKRHLADISGLKKSDSVFSYGQWQSILQERCYNNEKSHSKIQV